MGARCCCCSNTTAVATEREVGVLDLDVQQNDEEFLEKQAVQSTPAAVTDSLFKEFTGEESPVHVDTGRGSSERSIAGSSGGISIDAMGSLDVNMCTVSNELRQQEPFLEDPSSPVSNKTPNGNSSPSAGTKSQEELLTLEDMKLLGEMQTSKNPVAQWMYASVNRWRALPVGDACEGMKFLDVAESITGIYPYVFCMGFAQKHLTKDLQEQVSVAKKNWPAGAVSVRDAIRKEVANIGVPEIEKRYWNTCTCRILWAFRAAQIMQLILEGIAESDVDPVKCAQQSLNTVIGHVMNTALKKVADFIIWFCCFKRRDKLFGKMGLPEQDMKRFVRVLLKVLKPHVEFLESVFNEEVPSVVNKRPG